MNHAAAASAPTVIIGAGYTGLAAAFDLARAGRKVVIYEAESAVGGLAGSFEISPGYWIEKFYHHWFTSDTSVLDLARELGLEARIGERQSNTGLYYANSIFRLASPLDLLRFTPLPLIDRIRMGLMALYARRIENWPALEDQSVEEWVRRYGGKKAWEVVWKPLLTGKFGPETPAISAVWFWNKLKLRGSSRNAKGGESLVYLDGGFKVLTETLERRLLDAGVEIHRNTPVREIVSSAGTVTGVRTDAGVQPAAAVLATVPLPVFLGMTPSLPDSYRSPAAKIRFLGNVCLVLRLRRSLSSTYWLNVADPSFPYVGIIEHTNFDAPEKYGGEHVAYLSKYLPTSDPMFTLDDAALFAYSLPHIQRMFPDFSPDSWVIGYKAWRAEYSQPVITKRYSTMIPAERTPLRNLYLSTMAQIYPEDRGTNYAVGHGRKVARLMLDDRAGLS